MNTDKKWFYCGIGVFILGLIFLCIHDYSKGGELNTSVAGIGLMVMAIGFKIFEKK